ncbi:MAG: hypothetical protein AAGG38_12195 [Planctomycetota bacterium]
MPTHALGEGRELAWTGILAERRLTAGEDEQEHSIDFVGRLRLPEAPRVLAVSNRVQFEATLYQSDGTLGRSHPYHRSIEYHLPTSRDMSVHFTPNDGFVEQKVFGNLHFHGQPRSIRSITGRAAYVYASTEPRTVEIELDDESGFRGDVFSGASLTVTQKPIGGKRLRIDFKFRQRDDHEKTEEADALPGSGRWVGSDGWLPWVQVIEILRGPDVLAAQRGVEMSWTRSGLISEENSQAQATVMFKHKAGPPPDRIRFTVFDRFDVHWLRFDASDAIPLIEPLATSGVTRVELDPPARPASAPR